MSISIQALRAFRAAAGTGNFTRAAEQCYLSQPAFSRLIASLEKELGVKLFRRNTRRVELTGEGKICLARTEQILSAYDLMLEELKRDRGSGELRVGFNPVSGPPEFLVRALKRMREEHPGTHVNLVRAYSYDLVAQVLQGELDCALVSEAYIADEEALERKALQRIYTYALMHESDPLAGKGEVFFQDLSGRTLLFMKNSAPLTRRSALRKLRELNIPVREDLPANDLEELVLRVRLGSAVGITSFCDPNHQYDDLRAIPIHRDRKGHNYRVLLWRKDCQSPALEGLREILDQEAPLGKEENAT